MTMDKLTKAATDVVNCMGHHNSNWARRLQEEDPKMHAALFALKAALRDDGEKPAVACSPLVRPPVDWVLEPMTDTPHHHPSGRTTLDDR
jgi:hypothetical protein